MGVGNWQNLDVFGLEMEWIGSMEVCDYFEFSDMDVCIDGCKVLWENLLTGGVLGGVGGVVGEGAFGTC